MKKYFQGKKLQTATSFPSCSNSIDLSDALASPSTPPPPGRGVQKGKSGLKLSPQRSAGNAIARIASLTSSSPKSKRSEKTSTPKNSQLQHSSQRQNLGNELERVFKVFDADGDGQISQTELGFVLRSLGDNPTEEDLRSIIEHADTDGDGFISLEEFINFNKSSTESSPTTDGDGGERRGTTEEECVKAAFRTFDKDGNGFITATELHGVLLGMGDAHSLEDCFRMIRSFDKDGDGFVDYQEFRSLLGVC